MATDNDEDFLQFLDTQPIEFGKYKGETPEQIAKHSPGYVRWMYENVKPRVCSNKLNLAVDEAIQADNQSRERGWGRTSGRDNTIGSFDYRTRGHDYGGSLRGDQAQQASDRDFNDDYNDDIPF